MIFYFLDSQLKYIYQYDKSIRIDNQIFATSSKPTAIVIDITGKVYVFDTGNYKVQKYTTNGIFVKQ